WLVGKENIQHIVTLKIRAEVEFPLFPICIHHEYGCIRWDSSEILRTEDNAVATTLQRYAEPFALPAYFHSFGNDGAINLEGDDITIFYLFVAKFEHHLFRSYLQLP